MQEKNTLQIISFYIGILLLVIIFIFIYLQQQITDIVMEITGQSLVTQSQQLTDKTTKLLLSLDQIVFDTAVLSLPFIQNLRTFPSYPIDAESLSNFGKVNPFVGSFTVVTPQASSTPGGVVYTGQRVLNNGGAVRAAPQTNR